jgi:hypothetical protein
LPAGGVFEPFRVKVPETVVRGTSTFNVTGLAPTTNPLCSLADWLIGPDVNEAWP